MSVDLSELSDIGRGAGLSAVGFCRAEPFRDIAATLHERKQAGLHAGMQFTYRNPDRSTDPNRLVPGAAALVVGALEFGASEPERPDDESPYARVAAYARRDYYTSLRRALEAIAVALRDRGHRAVVSADANGLVDRAAAHRAAIGWWGKNSNILVPGSGSLVVLGAVVTDARLVSADPEPVADGCGSCRRCLDGCPTGAIVAPGKVDARRCLAWLVQADGVFDPDYRVALGDRIYGCDDCSDVCPPNRVHLRRRSAGQAPEAALSQSAARAARERSEQERETPRPDARGSHLFAHALSAGQASGDGLSQSAATLEIDGDALAPGQAWVGVLDLLEASDDELLADYGRWYIPKRQPRYLRRNALVVLANVGHRSDPRVRAAVEAALGDADPLIRAHGVWCARRLGLGLDALTGRNDPLVRSELQRPVPPRAAA